MSDVDTQLQLDT